ncbi:hypothetical protein [Micromonospora sp. WMMD1082]|uniref:hypothetical protein n=1 Tax=Micromonospora sp. WMMD1082 TaxID=3016104 RepID=UPI002417C85C|nr:hypothetical protein [Micromonospora sp. WMMD1082]MDG4795399.1 hypothetical protein [Micromonospora sp. WMMD1082]
MPKTFVVVVCLPADTPTDQLVATAVARLASSPWTSAGPAGHFPITTRWRRGRLVQPWHDTAAGGPLHLLDLDAMRATAWDASWRRWDIWHRVVAGTRPALPYWHFVDRHRAEPHKYSLAKAQQHYLAQPRIAAMRIYNALRNKIGALPTNQLEAFQASDDGNAYAYLGLLTAVPRDGLITLDGHHLAPASDRLADCLSYLESAQQHLNTLSSRDHLVAVATA